MDYLRFVKHGPNFSPSCTLTLKCINKNQGDSVKMRALRLTPPPLLAWLELKLKISVINISLKKVLKIRAEIYHCQSFTEDFRQTLDGKSK